MIIVYAPFQGQMFPLWYKIASVSWYAGWSIFVVILQDNTYSGQYTNDMFSTYINIYTNINLYLVHSQTYTLCFLRINIWTVGYTSTGLVWVWMLPFVWAVFGIIWSFQVLEFAIYWQLLNTEHYGHSILFQQRPHPINQGSQIINGVFGTVAYTLVLIIFMRIYRKSFETQFPWISARSTIADRKYARWPCVSPIARFLNQHCMCCTCCYICLMGYSRVSESATADATRSISTDRRQELLIIQENNLI